MTIESLSTDQPSDTLDAVSSTRAQQPARRGYGALWRGVPRELGFLVLTMPIAYAGFSILNGVLWAGVGTLIIYIGVFLVAGSLYIARGFGTLELVRLRWAGQPEIARPDWNPGGKPITFWRGVFGPYANGHYWLYLLHAMVINPIISMISWVFTIVWVSVGLGGVTYWFWDRFIPQGNSEIYLSKVIYEFMVPGSTAPFDPIVGDNIMEFVLGAILSRHAAVHHPCDDADAPGRRPGRARPVAVGGAPAGGRRPVRVTGSRGRRRGPVAAPAGTRPA